MNHSKRFQSLQNTSDSILQYAMSTSNLQEFVDFVGEQMHAEIIISDTLHYLLAMTSAVRNYYPTEPVWDDLIHAGFVPPVMKFDKKNPVSPAFLSSHTEILSPFLIVHSSLATESGRNCVMCDVLDNGNHLLKVAVSVDGDFSSEQERLFLTFVEVLQLTMHRFQTASLSNRQDVIFRRLIQGEPVSPVTNGPSFFDADGEYIMVCCDTSYLSVNNLTFLSLFSGHTKNSRLLSAQIENHFFVLFNTHYEYEEAIEFLKSFSLEHHFPVLCSPVFSSLKDIPEKYDELKGCAEIASHLEGCISLHDVSDFSMYQMFLEYYTSSSVKKIHPDAKLIFSYDQKHNTQYSQTLFRYLVNDCEASSTAKALFIHRNTLDNRLRKISELVLADWHNINYKFSMSYSLFVLLYQANSLQW